MNTIKWTQFWDMHSGGGTKEPPYNKIYIEAPEEEAKVIFYNMFGHNPERVTCTCCGEDYSINESDSLKEASAFHRDCKWDDKTSGYIEQPNDYAEVIKTVKEYENQSDVLVIYDKNIKNDERSGDVPDEGFIWH